MPVTLVREVKNEIVRTIYGAVLLREGRIRRAGLSNIWRYGLLNGRQSAVANLLRLKESAH
jgi:hypothetical protein